MWWFLLIIACLTIFGGFLCVRVRLTDNNFGLFSFILGASLTICGIQNFFSLFYLGRIVKRATAEFNKHATDITEDAVVADSYISTDPKRIKEEILTIENNKTINVADFEEVEEKEKLEK